MVLKLCGRHMGRTGQEGGWIHGGSGGGRRVQIREAVAMLVLDGRIIRPPAHGCACLDRGIGARGSKRGLGWKSSQQWERDDATKTTAVTDSTASDKDEKVKMAMDQSRCERHSLFFPAVGDAGVVEEGWREGRLAPTDSRQAGSEPSAGVEKSSPTDQVHNNAATSSINGRPRSSAARHEKSIYGRGSGW